MTVTNLPVEGRRSSRQAETQQLESATIRFAGDSGDGMQLAGTQFTNASAIIGNDISTLPDFPAEIRAPAGTLAGVSGFQVHFSSQDIHTPGDDLNALVAMNPAALKTNLKDLEKSGILIINSDAFTTSDLHKAGYKTNPLEDGSLKEYRLFKIPINKLNRDAVAEVKLSPREADRCKNFFALGLVYWLYERPLEPTLRWIRDKFSKHPAVLEANTRTLKAGYHYGETTEALPAHYVVPPASIKPGRYRQLTGNEAFAMVFEAVRIAINFMTPVILLSDGYLANGAEPWLIPAVDSLPKIVVKHPQEINTSSNGDHFLPYKRDDRLVRQWALPGTPGLE